MFYRRISPIYEKYSLQQYEGKIKDLVIGDIEQLNKIAILVCLNVFKYSVFCVQRPLKFGNVSVTLNYIVYDRDYADDSEITSAASRVLDHRVQLGPGVVEGYAYHNDIVLYMPISLDTAPFTSKVLNTEASDDLYDDISDEYLSYSDYVIKTDSTSILNTASYKSAHRDAVDAFLDELQADSAKQTLSIRTASVVQSLKHELTHILDDDTSVRDLNHFSVDSANNIFRVSVEDRPDMGEAMDILYSLWCYTEFNAFTQTYGKQSSNKRSTTDLVDPKYIEKVSSSIIGRPIGIDQSQSLDDYVESVQGKIGRISSNTNDRFWEYLRDVVIEGSRDTSQKDRLKKMSPQKFKKYFIYTTFKLIEKFKEKTIKNVAAQNVHDSDIKKLALTIKNACDKYLQSKYDSESEFSIRLKFDYYFSEYDEAYPVIIDFTTSPIKKLYKNNDSMISSRTNVKLRIPQLQLLLTQTAEEVFGKSENSYSELYKELTSQQRKSYLDRIFFSLADDIDKYLNDTV